MQASLFTSTSRSPAPATSRFSRARDLRVTRYQDTRFNDALSASSDRWRGGGKWRPAGWLIAWYAGARGELVGRHDQSSLGRREHISSSLVRVFVTSEEIGQQPPAQRRFAHPRRHRSGRIRLLTGKEARVYEITGIVSHNRTSTHAGVSSV